MTDLKFKKLAEQRTNRILNDLRLLGNLSNKTNYSYTKKEIDLIFETIEQSLRLSRERFDYAFKDGGSKKKFTL